MKDKKDYPKSPEERKVYHIEKKVGLTINEEANGQCAFEDIEAIFTECGKALKKDKQDE